MYALFLARELYPDGIVYYSAATHYSVQKSLHLLRMPSVVIRAEQHGEIDYDDLANVIGQHRDRPVIVFANIGTTMHEARDNVQTIGRCLNRKQSTSILFIVTQPCRGRFQRLPSRIIHSILPLAPTAWLRAAIVVRKSHKDRIGRLIPYIGSTDTTLSGSRNGHTPLFLWYAIQKHGASGFRKRAQEGIKLADYALQRLKKIGWESWRNSGTLTVMLAPPPAQLIAKWQLATTGDWSHIICMPGVTKPTIDAFIEELQTVKPDQALGP